MTGNNVGDIFLWNAGVPTSVSFAMAIPRVKPITSLIFVPDSTALRIISGDYLFVRDIEKAGYVANSGLPEKARSIALYGPRNRLAVVINDRIIIYQLILPEEMENDFVQLYDPFLQLEVTPLLVTVYSWYTQVTQPTLCHVCDDEYLL
jgi:hypothetical protein